MHILVGTSGWSYKEWKGSFYPPDLPADDMLRHYATKLPTVEINNSFYRIPREKVLMEWAAQVPPEFRFVLKASRRITHINRLTDADDSLGYFLQTVNVLGDKLGPTLFQCPPSLKLDLPRLRDFLARVPRTWRAALEFRHDSWFTDEVYDALRDHDIALVAVDEDEGATPLVPTAYVGLFPAQANRLHHRRAASLGRADREPAVAGGVRIPQARRGGRDGPGRRHELA